MSEKWLQAALRINQPAGGQLWLQRAMASRSRRWTPVKAAAPSTSPTTRAPTPIASSPPVASSVSTPAEKETRAVVVDDVVVGFSGTHESGDSCADRSPPGDGELSL